MMSKEQEKAILEFDDHFPNGIFVAPPKDNQPHIRIRDAYEKVKKLGRPLTDEEMKEFETFSSN